MADPILERTEFFLAVFLFLLGILGMLSRGHLMRKLMAMNIMQVGVIVFFIALSAKFGGGPPILEEGALGEPTQYTNPLPHALMLTAIVVSVSTTGVALALLLRIHKRFGTLDESALLEKLKGK